MSHPIVEAIEERYAEALRLLEEREYGGATDLFAELISLLDQVGDYLGQARVLIHLAQIAELQEQPEESEDYYREALDLAHMIADRRLEGLIAHQLGQLLCDEAPEEACQLYLRSAECCAAVADERGEALSLAMVGQAALAFGDETEGLRRLLEAIDRLSADAPERSLLIQRVSDFAGQLDHTSVLALLGEQIRDPDLLAQIRQRVEASL